jgi:hypothetical protein
LLFICFQTAAECATITGCYCIPNGECFIRSFVFNINNCILGVPIDMVDSATYYLRITSYNMASLVTSAIFQVQSIFVKFRIWFCHLDKGHANYCHHLASAVCRNFSRLNFLSDAHYTYVSDSPTIYLRLPPLLNIKNSFIDKYCTILIQNVLNLEHTRSLTYRRFFPWNISFRWWIANMQIKLRKKP